MLEFEIHAGAAEHSNAAPGQSDRRAGWAVQPVYNVITSTKQYIGCVPINKPKKNSKHWEGIALYAPLSRLTQKLRGSAVDLQSPFQNQPKMAPTTADNLYP